MQTDGWSVAHLATEEGVPRRQELRAVVRRGGAIIDPEILLVREVPSRATRWLGRRRRQPTGDVA